MQDDITEADFVEILGDEPEGKCYEVGIQEGISR
tara:strand:+ start:1164 stop:1265 length:102 start_codon:yes stop_codon:yes gene_type:complete